MRLVNKDDVVKCWVCEKSYDTATDKTVIDAMVLLPQEKRWAVVCVACEKTKRFQETLFRAYYPPDQGELLIRRACGLPDSDQEDE